MMNRGVQQMDALFGRWLAAGQLQPDPSLIVPELPPLPEPEEEAAEPPRQVEAQFIQVVVTSPYSPVGWLRSIPGVLEIREFGNAVLSVRYRGTPQQLGAALAARGWQNDFASGLLRITGYRAQQPQPAPTPPPAPPPPAPAPATNTVQPAPPGGQDS